MGVGVQCGDEGECFEGCFCVYGGIQVVEVVLMIWCILVVMVLGEL